MRIISIDVGIKNLAYCILECDNKKENDCSIYNIIQWDVINLCEEEHLCNCSLKSKVKKSKKNINKTGECDNIVIVCNKKATYVKTINDNTNYYCQIHAKQSNFLLPNKSLKNIKTWKRDALISYAAVQKIVFEENIKKDALIKLITDYLKDITLDKITSISANDMTLIQMGIKLAHNFDAILDLNNIDQIVIENQISPIANRMKTLQGMIAQYFIMRDKPNISFISSANKLKAFCKDNIQKNYSERKKEGVRIVKEILEKDNLHKEWISLFSTHKKKDDMADSFLQGIWFLNNKL